jgi:CheY-like chemotaxis protein
MCSVLVIDDITDCREPLARFLSYVGYKTASAASAAEALTYLQTHLPDLILLDLMMPEMDGVDFLRILRCAPQLKHLPVILVTAVAEGNLLREAEALGIAGSLLKSRFTADELLARVAAVCPG